jgi:hypothetical protein
MHITVGTEKISSSIRALEVLEYLKENVKPTYDETNCVATKLGR